MALTLVATVGAANANSFATAAEAVTVAEGVYPEPTAWLDADPATREAALVTATAILVRLRWVGSRVTATQALSWPRYGAPIPDGFGSYESTVIPNPVVRATCRLAFWLVAQAEETEDSMDLAPGIASLSLGGEVSISFEPGATAVTPLERAMQQEILPEVRGLTYAAGARLVRG